jgi:DNA-binding CsgD family transcriptional regulator
MAMHESELLSALIGDIYDAALNPALWIGVLEKTRAFIGGWAISLSWKDAVAKRGGSYFDEGNGVQPYRQLYFNKYIKMDPCTTGQFFAEIGEPITTVDLIAYEEFVQTRFYKEWVQPQGLVDAALAVLDKSATNFSFLALFRHQRDGFFDNEARRRMRLVVPHFRRAVLVGKLIDLKKAEAASLADTLDGVSAGMFLVDETGRLVHANVAGHVMLNAADVLHARGGCLGTNDQQADQVLADTFAAAGNSDAAVGAAVGVKGVAMPVVARDGERYVAHVLPLTSGVRRQAGTSYAAVAAVFVHKAALDMPSPPEAIAKAYKLTPTELRVLLAVVEVGGVPEVAETLGIAESTVKTHLGGTVRNSVCEAILMEGKGASYGYRERPAGPTSSWA